MHTPRRGHTLGGKSKRFTLIHVGKLPMQGLRFACRVGPALSRLPVTKKKRKESFFKIFTNQGQIIFPRDIQCVYL